MLQLVEGPGLRRDMLHANHVIIDHEAPNDKAASNAGFVDCCDFWVQPNAGANK